MRSTSGVHRLGLGSLWLAGFLGLAGVLAGQEGRLQEPRTSSDAVEKLVSELGELIVGGEPAAAMRRAEVALAEFEKTGDRRGQATCLAFLSIRSGAAGETEQEIAHRQRSLSLLSQIRYPFAGAAVAQPLGTLLLGSGRLEQAEKVLRRGLELLKEFETSGAPIPDFDYWLYAPMLGLPADLTDLSDPFSEATRKQLVRMAEGCLRSGLGEALTWQGRLTEAEVELEQAVELTRSAKSQLRQRVLTSLALLRQKQGRFEEARSNFEQALEMLESASRGRSSAAFRRGRRQLFELLDQLDRAEGRPKEALTRNARRLETAQKKSDQVAEVILLRQRAKLLRATADLVAARQALDAAHQVALELGDRDLETNVLWELGHHARETGDRESAVSYMEQVIARLQEGEQKPFTELTLAWAMLAVSYQGLGAHDRAERAIREAQSLSRKFYFPEGEAAALIAEAMSSSASVGEMLQKVSGIIERFYKDSQTVVTVYRSTELLLHAGRLIGAKASPEEIERIAEAALAAAQEEGFAHNETLSHVFLGHAYRQQGHTDRARQEWQEALKLLRRRGSRDPEARVLAGLADLAWEEGRRDEAVRLIAESVEVAEKTMADVRVDELLIPFFAGEVDLYDRAMLAFTAIGQPGKAFEYSERARARGLLRLVGNPRLRLGRPDQASLATELDALRAQMSELEEKLARAVGDDAEKTRADLESAWRRYEDLIVRIRLQNPAYAELLSPEPVDLEIVQKELISSGVTLISFYTLNDRVVAWIIDRENNSFASTRLTRDDFELIRCFGAEMVGGARQRGVKPLASCSDSGDLAKVLYEKLLSPVMPHVRHPNLIIVPHDSLHALPFAALRNPATGRYLIEDYTLSYAPSASVLRLLRQKTLPKSGQALVLGDPQTADEGLRPLSFARREAQTVARLLGARPLLGSEATESSLRTLGGQVDFLHVAAHAIYRPENPRFSHVALAAGDGQDGRLEMHEIFDDLDLEATSLVVLSACETALGEINRGDEILGFIRSFLYAGSRAVMATLWSVDDEASARLVEGFYQRFLRGLPAAEALRAAQLELLQDPRYSAPYLWAGYTLTGDPEVRWRSEQR